MDESQETIVIIGDDDAENFGSDNEEDGNDEQENNEGNDSEEDNDYEEADVSCNEDEVDTFCNSERGGGDSDDDTADVRETATLASPQVESHEHTEVEVNIESTPKRRPDKDDPGDEGRPSSSNTTPQSSNNAQNNNNNYKKQKGKGKAGSAGGKYFHNKGQKFNPQFKSNVNNQKGANNSNSEGYKNVQSPSQQNSPHPKNSNNNSKGGDDQSQKNKSGNSPKQSANKSNFNSGGNKNSSQGENNSQNVSKGQNNNKSCSYKSNSNNFINTSSNNNNKKNNSVTTTNKKNPDSVSVSSILSKDIWKDATYVMKSIMRKKVCAQPLDSPTLKLHYRLSVLLFVLLYTIIQGCWIWKEAIICINGFNADAEVPFRIKNYCLSYPFVYEGEQERRYILFYRWTHHSFLIIASVFYIPRLLAKTKDNPRLKQLLHDLAIGEHRYDCSTWEQDTKKMLQYMNNHGSTHGYLYLWLIVCHMVALALDCLVVWYLDYILQGRFMNLVYSAYPLHRDPHYFTDELSRTFPPFVRCIVHEQVLINNKREEWFGCHLLLMDIYDKMFVVIWVWLAFLIAVTVLTILVLFLWTIPPFNRLFLLMHTDSKHVKKLRNKIVKKYGYTDLYALHLMKRHRSEAEFMMLMSGLVHSEDPCETQVESKFKKSKVSFRDEVTSNSNYPPQFAPCLGSEKGCLDNSYQSNLGFAFDEAVRNRRIDASTPNPKRVANTYFHRGVNV